jgi:small subunit ribosomal protein S21
MEVLIRNDNLDEGLRILKRMVANDGILKELRLKQCFESKPERRKRKALAASRKRKQREKRLERFQ